LCRRGAEGKRPTLL
jgi:hypothetical protein